MNNIDNAAARTDVPWLLDRLYEAVAFLRELVACQPNDPAWDISPQPCKHCAWPQIGFGAHQHEANCIRERAGNWLEDVADGAESAEQPAMPDWARTREVAELERMLEAFVIDLERVAADPPPGKKLPSEVITEAGLGNYGRYDCPYCQAPIAHFLGCPWHDFRTFYQRNVKIFQPESFFWTTPEERLAALRGLIRRIRAYGKVPCPHCGGSNSHAPGCVLVPILSYESRTG